jgi:uncharacterized protein YlxP (DUF503 family)
VSEIGVLSVHFHLDGCRSLKERRGRMRGLRERLGRNPRLALCEAPSDDPEHSHWTIVAVGERRSAVAELLGQVEQELEERVDAVVLELQRELL